MSYPKLTYKYLNGKLQSVEVHHLDQDYVFDRQKLMDAILFYIEENLQWSELDQDNLNQ